MQCLRVKFLVVLAVLQCSFSSVPALAIERYMQLVAAGQGWAVGKEGLFWTQDDGVSWKNISPSGLRYFNDVFFLDASHGWTLSSSGGERENRLDFHVSSTVDGGATWTSSLVKAREQEPDEFDGAGWINFVDPQHGWLVLRRKTSSAFSWGWLLSTEDGGKTWKQLPPPPIAGRPSFATPSAGWLAGGAGGNELYATRDAGNTWQEQVLPAPATTGGATRPAYGRPEFKDAAKGFLPVTFSPENYSSGTQTSTLVLFSTDNGGRSWKPDRVLPSLHDEGVVLPTAVNIVDSVLILAPSFDRDHLTVMTIASDGTGNKVSSEVPRTDTTVREISFVSVRRGWVLTGGYRLLMTSDAGATWKWLVPGAPPRDLPAPLPRSHLTPLEKLGPGPDLPPPGRPPRLRDERPTGTLPSSSPLLYLAPHLGFDQQHVTTAANMQTWFDWSPFFDVGFYVGGGNYCYKSGGACLRSDPHLMSSPETCFTFCP